MDILDFIILIRQGRSLDANAVTPAVFSYTIGESFNIVAASTIFFNFC